MAQLLDLVNRDLKRNDAVVIDVDVVGPMFFTFTTDTPDPGPHPYHPR
jgi:hypothetical protein